MERARRVTLLFVSLFAANFYFTLWLIDDAMAAPSDWNARRALLSSLDWSLRHMTTSFYHC